MVRCDRIKGPFTYMRNDYDLRIEADLATWQEKNVGRRIINVQLMVAGSDPMKRLEDLLIFYEEEVS